MADFVNLDEQTRQMINDRTNAAAQLTGDFQKDKAAGLVKAFEPTKINYGKGGLNQAIQNKYQKNADTEINQIKKLQELNYPKSAMKDLMRASQTQTKQYQFDKQREMAIRQRIMAEESQRAQILGSMLGIAGTIGGAALGGGFGGMAGGQIGQTAGGMAAGGSYNNRMNEA